MHLPIQYESIEFILTFRDVIIYNAYVSGADVLDDFVILFLHLCVSRLYVRYI